MRIASSIRLILPFETALRILHQRLETRSVLVATRTTADDLTTVTVDFSPAQAAPSLRESPASRAVAALNHPNICQLYDVGPDYLVMESVEGTPVASVGTRASCST